jgi:hypothetical protein
MSLQMSEFETDLEWLRAEYSYDHDNLDLEDDVCYTIADLVSVGVEPEDARQQALFIFNLKRQSHDI